MTEAQKTKVMMLDDEGLLLQIYKIKFEKAGYEVSEYYAPEEALLALQKGYDPDIILFDITMPDAMSGYEFLETIQKKGLGKRSLKIALTNEGQEGEKARTAELGADAHLVKSSYIPSELVTVVSELLKKSRAERGRGLLGRLLG